MDVFAFREKLVEEYGRFTRSFCEIRAEDIKKFVDEKYAAENFWPSPIIQLNPNFKSGGRVDALVGEGLLEPPCAEIFAEASEPYTLYQHQVAAIKVAQSGGSYVLTTGTGSGKSLAYFIPIVNDVLRRKREQSSGPQTTAIVVYPMNALCNSQLEELERFFGKCDKDHTPPVTFARYTGQDPDDHKDWVAANPPDILLTNYVMLELIMTRFLPNDKRIRHHAQGLRFLVLDELHTYRGRQGADVAMLVRRVRERFNMDLQCVGTSATMSSGEERPAERNRVVANVASRLFGSTVKPEHVITETLTSVTKRSSVPTGAALKALIERSIPAVVSYNRLKRDPFTAWVEWTLGLEIVDGKLIRVSRPLSVNAAAVKLSESTGLRVDTCMQYLREYLLRASRSQNERGRNLFAFRLHQFISGAWSVFTSLEPPGDRHLTLSGQRFVPDDGERKRRLFPLCFCRECGQEYIPVWATKEGQRIESLDPRDLTERSNDDETIQSGFLLLDPERVFRADVVARNYPEDWVEIFHGAWRLKNYYRKYRPIAIHVDTLGGADESGTPGWYIPGPFRFCLNGECGAEYSGHVRSDLSKLSSLSGEGRSSATTILTLSVLKRLIEGDLDDEAKKLLAFTDNRQDASLQAGHFNDFIQVLLLRSALIAAVKQSPTQSLSDETIALGVLNQLRLTNDQFAANTQLRGPARERTRQTLLNVLGYRIYRDLERGWRINNPNLEQLGLLGIRYQGLKACCSDEEVWGEGPALLTSATAANRENIAHDLLERMRRALCIKTIYLDRNRIERLRNQSYNALKEPWGLSEGENVWGARTMVPESRRGRGPSDHMYLSSRSEFGRKLNAADRWGEDNPYFTGNLSKDEYSQVINALLTALGRYGLIEVVPLANRQSGYQINSSVMEWHLPSNEDAQRSNLFFRRLYQDTANLLSDNNNFLHRIAAREHTAQVESEDREEREKRFRQGLKKDGLPVLYCSPTMELGVDIATLNTVYMRNVPPTPANYVQRGGRAGRSGQPALVVTYCAARSPHDQYFFQDPRRMVSGEVNPPSIDLANEELIRSHLHAVWLAETGVRLDSTVKDLLDLEDNQQPVYQELHAQLDRSLVREQAMLRSGRILETIHSDLTTTAAPWYSNDWVNSAVQTAWRRFDTSFERWRSLYRATTTQMDVANRVIGNPAANATDRDRAKNQHDEAFRQQKLLLSATDRRQSDFATYRYLAAQGFLPGYNFPRLPLMAFIPGSRLTGSRQSVLNRPRFIGLAEFGPQSFIYHEGNTFRVAKAMLSIDEVADASSRRMLPVREVAICSRCGYGHFGAEKDSECCVRCEGRLTDARIISNLFRIEQVSTRRVNRITSDAEERQRQGYEMITTYKFATKDGTPLVDSFQYVVDGEVLIELEFGPTATLWRVNLGWRRRRAKTIYGFNVDPNTGIWAKNEQAPTDAEDDRIENTAYTERITPYVQDTKNVLIIKPSPELDDTAVTTLQYAFKRGIEKVYQLENSELAAEPLPDASNRRAILLYEASEGGAGVLNRIARDASALGRVARAALEICHYEAQADRWSSHKALTDQLKNCEAGCYKCLLSYYNQLDHDRIDRKHEAVIAILCQLTAAKQERTRHIEIRSPSLDALIERCDSDLERDWLRFLSDNDYVLPDRAQPLLKGYKTRPDFQYFDHQVIVYVDGIHHFGEQKRKKDAEVRASLAAAGYTVISFAHRKKDWPKTIDRFAWVFRPSSVCALHG